MTVEALVFDLDGLIVDTEGPAYESWRSIYNEHGAELELTLWQAEIGTAAVFDAVAHLKSLTGRALDREALLERRRQLKDTLSRDSRLMPASTPWSAQPSEPGSSWASRRAAAASGSSAGWSAQGCCNGFTAYARATTWRCPNRLPICTSAWRNAWA